MQVDGPGEAGFVAIEHDHQVGAGELGHQVVGEAGRSLGVRGGRQPQRRCPVGVLLALHQPHCLPGTDGGDHLRSAVQDREEPFRASSDHPIGPGHEQLCEPLMPTVAADAFGGRAFLAHYVLHHHTLRIGIRVARDLLPLMLWLWSSWRHGEQRRQPPQVAAALPGLSPLGRAAGCRDGPVTLTERDVEEIDQPQPERLGQLGTVGVAAEAGQQHHPAGGSLVPADVHGGGLLLVHWAGYEEVGVAPTLAALQPQSVRGSGNPVERHHRARERGGW